MMGAAGTFAPPVRRALICLRYGIGDVVMELPTLRHLRAQWPGVHLTALGAHPATELLEGDAVVDALARVQDFGFGHWGDAGTPAARERAAEWVEDNAFERVLDAGHSVTGMRQVLHAAGAPILDSGGPVDVPPGDARGGSAVRSILDSAVAAWGLPELPGEVRPRLHIGAQARVAAEALLQRRGLLGQSRIAIAPVASSHLKRWPIERVCELIRRLAAAGSGHILVFGLDTDAPTAGRLRQVDPERVAIIPPVHLQQTAALLERCQVVVSNDTGLMHMGAAVESPTVALFGPSSPRALLPPGATPVSTDTPCDYRKEHGLGPPQCVLADRCLIGEHGCIERISVDAVEAAVRAPLDGAAPARNCGQGGP